MAAVFDVLCGESGIITQITEAQDRLNQLITSGKNDIFLIQRTINEIKELSDPDVLKRRLQDDLFRLLSEEALADPGGTIGGLLEIRAAYQEAGPAIDRIIENVEQFIRDPLGTPLNLCEDIPNIVRLGDAVFELGKPAQTPDSNPQREDSEPFDIVESVSKFDTIPRFEKDKFQLIGNLPEGYEPPKPNVRIGPGAANRAALGE